MEMIKSNCTSDFSNLKMKLKTKLTTIAEVLEHVVATFEQNDIQLLKDVDEITKTFAELESAASTYFLNCILSEYTAYSKEIAHALQAMSSKKHGALVVIQGSQPIDPFISKGIPLYAQISSPLLQSIFHPESSMHKGATLIQSDMIISVSNMLPLSEQIFWDRIYDARELSALGLSERTDALILLVYDNGLKSFCLNGHLYPFSSL